jgi:signal transduction histidine kinase
MAGVDSAARPVERAAGRLPSLPRFHRSEPRVVAGVCAGIGDTLGVDPTVVRLVFVVLALASGSGIVLYLGAWLLLPAPGSAERRGGAARAGGFVLLGVGAVLAMRGLGLQDSLLWPAALIAGGVVLVARRPQTRRTTVLGIVLVVGGTLLFVNASNPFGEAMVEPGAVAIVLVAIVAPWIWRVAQERDAEPLARTRSQERAELAARVHDSVLQTLALIQRHADDPRRIAVLARQQERELRSWLYGREREGALVSAVERAAAEVEDLHGVRVEVVASGDADLDERHDALVLAAREAMTNAAKFAGVDVISVYVEAGPSGATVFVRDTGVGFDRDLVPADRHGIRESIERRLERHGGAARIASRPGAGTEVELTMPAVSR